MTNDYSHALKYAGAEPFRPEDDREDITTEEYELLTQDPTYQKLAQVRYLADKLESELAGTNNPVETREQLFAAVAADDAPLTYAVTEYVDAWLAQHRASDVGCEHPGCELEAAYEYEVNAPGRGHDTSYYCGEHIEERQDGVYANVRILAGVDV